MGFFKKSAKRSYNLFGTYDNYIPDVSGVVVLLVMFLVGSLLASAVILLVSKFFSVTAAQQYGIMLSYPVMFIPAMLYAAAMSHRNAGFEPAVAVDSSHWGRYKGWQWAFIVTVTTLALAFVSDGITALLPPMSEKMENMMKMLLEGPFWATFISVSVFAPFFEEWLCRGMILRGLLQKYNPVTAICVSALCFALIHGNIWQGLVAFISGCVFGYVYYRTGSLKLTMLMHFVNNTFSLVLSRIGVGEGLENFFQLMSVWAYVLIMLCALLILFCAYLALRSVPLDDRRGNCDINEVV